MKLTVILLITVIMQVSANTYAQKITINQKNITLDQVFKQIRQQSGYDFLFDSQLIKKAKPVSIQLNNVTVEDAVKKSLEGQALTYTISEHTVVIKEKGFIENLKDKLFADPEFITITGRVTSVNGDVLSGAVILIKRTKQGATADANGFFVIKMAKPTDTLTCSFIGYKNQVIPINKKYFLDVKLTETTNALDEVVVQAYGQTTQRLTTGNIGRLTAKDIAIQPVMDPLLALEGKIPGLIVTPQTGYEGGPMKVEIRGRNSTNTSFASDPLYIIDGVPLIVMETTKRTTIPAYGNSVTSRGFDQTSMSFAGGQNPLFSINPGDIESIEVLKDADATAIYGSRGANGVILISTKKGKIGATRLDASVSQGLRFVTGYWDMLSTPQYLNMRREAFRNDGIIPNASNAPDLTVWDQNANTDWQKYAYGGMGHWTDAQTSLSGGTEQYTYRLGAAFNRTTDITTVSGVNQRGSLSFAFNNHSQNKRFNMGVTANYSSSLMNQIGLSGIATLAPNAPAAFDANGNLNFNGWGAQRTAFPFASLLKPYTSKTNYLQANLLLSYALTKELSVKTSLGYNNSIADQTYTSPYTSLDPTPIPPGVPSTASASFGSNKTSNWIVEPQIEYNKLISKGTLNALLGGTLQATTTSGSTVSGTKYTTDALLNTITAAGAVTATDQYAQYKYTGVFARVGYNWENRYIINLNGRRDGSSRFGLNNQFGNFGSVGAAWIASDELFIKHFLPEAISFVKLRGSYGITGSDAVGEYAYLSQYTNPFNASGVPTIPIYNGVAALVPSILPNDEFHWQVNKKLEGALDISLFNDRLNLETAYYRNRCDNQLIGFPTPDISGFTSVVANSPANVQNSGYEFTLNATIFDKKSFTWHAGFNIGFNKNVLLSYPNLNQSPYFKIYRIGESLDNKYVLNYTGVDPLTGQYTYEDYNHDGKVTANESVVSGTQNDDRYVAINTAPQYSGGMNHQFTYKGVTFNAVFTFRKQMGNNSLTTIGGTRNASVYQYENRWQYPGQTALTARVSTTSTNSDNMLSGSNAVWTDASFIRLQTIALAYNLPVKLISRIGLKNLSVSVNAQNIFVLTKFKGIDPEYQSFGSLPPVRTIVTGLSCSF